MNKSVAKHAYNLGVMARELGLERISPITETLDEQFWYAGFDNVNFNEFYKFVREDRRAIKSKLGYSRIGLNNI